MRRRLVWPACALLGACTVGPDYHGPPRAAPEATSRGSFVRASDPALTATPGLARWWETLDDAVLSALVDDALAHAPTIDAATARIREARAKLRQTRAQLLPAISASGTYVHAELPGTGLGSIAGDSGSSASGGSSSLDFYNVGANVSWEPDLFGGSRRGVEAARATLGQRLADLADAQVSLSAQVAQTYVNLREVEERARLNVRSSALQHQALVLTRQRYAAGTASGLEVERLTTELESTDAQNTPLAAQIDGYKDALAVLTGREPGALDARLAVPTPVPLPPVSVAIGDPAALIAQRPDVRSAERALATATAQIGINQAKLFPSIRFMGILGLGGTSPGDVLDPGNLSVILAPMLSWPLLDFGRNRAAVDEAEAQRDAAQAQYLQAVLEALQDAEDSLSRFGSTRQQLAQLLRSEQSADRAAVLNRQRYAAGTSSLIDQLDIERQRLSAQLAAAQAKAQLTIDYIAVNKALGLGWGDGQGKIPGPSPQTP